MQFLKLQLGPRHPHQQRFPEQHLALKRAQQSGGVVQLGLRVDQDVAVDPLRRAEHGRNQLLDVDGARRPTRRSRWRQRHELPATTEADAPRLGKR